MMLDRRFSRTALPIAAVALAAGAAHAQSAGQSGGSVSVQGVQSGVSLRATLDYQSSDRSAPIDSLLSPTDPRRGTTQSVGITGNVGRTIGRAAASVSATYRSVAYPDDPGYDSDLWDVRPAASLQIGNRCTIGVSGLIGERSVVFEEADLVAPGTVETRGVVGQAACVLPLKLSISAVGSFDEREGDSPELALRDTRSESRTLQIGYAPTTRTTFGIFVTNEVGELLNPTVRTARRARIETTNTGVFANLKITPRLTTNFQLGQLTTDVSQLEGTTTLAAATWRISSRTSLEFSYGQDRARPQDSGAAGAFADSWIIGGSWRPNSRIRFNASWTNRETDFILPELPPNAVRRPTRELEERQAFEVTSNVTLTQRVSLVLGWYDVNVEAVPVGFSFSNQGFRVGLRATLVE
jgi:hypothetical protein